MKCSLNLWPRRRSIAFFALRLAIDWRGNDLADGGNARWLRHAVRPLEMRKMAAKQHFHIVCGFEAICGLFRQQLVDDFT